MSSFTPFKLAESSLNFIGSALSSMSTAFVILYFFVSHRSSMSRSHFRHKLILNLAIADFVNSTSNAISGAYVLVNQKDLVAGPACIINGLVGQITVQATDCAILSIALVTVYMIVNANRMPNVSSPSANRRIYAICAATWVLPCITGFLALGKGYYVPVSGSWCWLVAKPVYLRYILTHGWRIFFIVIEICLYTYLYVFLKSRQHHGRSSKISASNHVQLQVHTAVPQPASKSDSEWSDSRSSVPPVKSEPPVPYSSAAVWSQLPQTRSFSLDSYIRRVLLLRAYPIAYMVLWIPGILNRFVELAGKSAPALQLMQASTQFVGMANAMTYGLQLMRSARRR